ncbi:alpha-L-glutamate ligase [Nostoc sp. CENA67]|uniref:Alpha-L-glutamate ligase n=1 Tax=Amazonocrinis nigriterrae CENA67 TaxID=2794033 RepID=A0A8J7HXK8_9NOST|nr:alpha-L-glutamate ligase [Amazonocrinis nigriterrae]MBH8565385.1 alpha-L-glutamate ligase [Amazonocrinis nigriterrae CENA67]
MINNIRLWIEACKELEINFEFIHPNQNLIKLIINNKNYYFANYDTPFVSKIISEMFQYRDYTYHLLKGIVNVPKTKAFLSPFCQDPLYKDWAYSEYRDIDFLVEEINQTFSLPVIIKKTAKSSVNNVFICHDRDNLRISLEKIYQFNSDKYNNFALASEYIDINHEYRAIIFNNELFLVYEKSRLEPHLSSDLSPTDCKVSKYVYINNENLIDNINNFIQPIFKKIPISYGQFNIALDKNGEYWLTEIIPHPNFDSFIKNNSEQIIVDMFKRMLISLGSE